MFTVHIVWNREFYPVRHSSYEKITDAVKAADRLLDLGDGASVKKAFITDPEDGVVWQYGDYTVLGNIYKELEEE